MPSCHNRGTAEAEKAHRAPSHISKIVPLPSSRPTKLDKIENLHSEIRFGSVVRLRPYSAWGYGPLRAERVASTLTALPVPASLPSVADARLRKDVREVARFLPQLATDPIQVGAERPHVPDPVQLPVVGHHPRATASSLASCMARGRSIWRNSKDPRGMLRRPAGTPPSASQMWGSGACRNLKDMENSTEERHRQSYDELAGY